MVLPSLTFAADGGAHPYRWPFGISMAGHLILLGLMFYTPNWNSTPNYMPSVIDVQMVDLSELNPAPIQSAEKSKDAASVAEPMKEEKPSESAVQAESTAKPEISVAPPRKKTKTALKTKTFKSKKVLKNALKRVEKKVGTLPPKPLEDTLKRLREKVAKEGKPAPPSAGKTKVQGKGKKGAFFSKGSQKETELIDLYRLEIAYAINKNWAFAEQLSGGGDSQMSSLAFKVMPDGQIVDIFFTDRSGNQYLDDSAQKAIIKSSPVAPHPEKLQRSYVEMGLRFTPKGVQ